jgi:protease II
VPAVITIFVPPERILQKLLWDFSPYSVYKKDDQKWKNFVSYGYGARDKPEPYFSNRLSLLTGGSSLIACPGRWRDGRYWYEQETLNKKNTTDLSPEHLIVEKYTSKDNPRDQCGSGRSLMVEQYEADLLVVIRRSFCGSCQYYADPFPLTIIEYENGEPHEKEYYGYMCLIRLMTTSSKGVSDMPNDQPE